MKLALKPTFIRNRNVRNFESVMDGLTDQEGIGQFACVYGRAGRGKTRTCVWWHAAHPNSIYIRMLAAWSTSPGGFLNALLEEMNLSRPYTIADRFNAVVAALRAEPKTIFLDEIEKLPARFLEIARDLTDLAGCPLVMIGEEELYHVMARHRKVWSRTTQTLRFEPLDTSDVIIYAKQAGGFGLPEETAEVLRQASGGDFRIIKRDLAALCRFANSKKTSQLTPAMARTAVRAGMKGTT